MTTDIAEPKTRRSAALRAALAVTFLTRLPLPVRGEVTPDDLRASMGWYPVVGLGLGVVGWGLYAALSRLLPPIVAAALTVLLLEAATGALHLDGFMDTCDGLGSGRAPARMLEIMKDSRVGAMGVFGAVGVLLLKVVALAALTPAPAPLIIAAVTGRALPALDTLLFPYARAHGTGAAFAAGHSTLAPASAVVVALTAAYLLAGGPGTLLAAGVIVAVLLVHARISTILGGLTGDVYGMGIELAEVLVLVSAAALTGFRI
jgi:adenosylcobinamide-GDP ribazoletransferase